MRCEREKAARRSSIGWKVIFALMVISLVAGIVVAAMVTR
jgi:Na+-transporting NADH:ubiquinone oxidoreductase subunit NqrC